MGFYCKYRFFFRFNVLKIQYFYTVKISARNHTRQNLCHRCEGDAEAHTKEEDLRLKRVIELSVV